MQFNTTLFLEQNSKKLGLSLYVLSFVLIYPVTFELKGRSQKAGSTVSHSAVEPSSILKKAEGFKTPDLSPLKGLQVR